MHANIPTKVGTLAIALSQAPSYRRSGVVLSCVSSCERKACANNETNVRLRNLRTTTPQHIKCSLLSLQGAHVNAPDNTFASCTASALLGTHHITITIGV